jgi:hypothetical protein
MGEGVSKTGIFVMEIQVRREMVKDQEKCLDFDFTNIGIISNLS